MKDISIRIKILGLIGVVVFFIVINVLIFANRRDTINPIDDNANYCYYIDQVKIDGGKLMIDGWFFVLRSVHNGVMPYSGEKTIGVYLLDSSVDQIPSKVDDSLVCAESVTSIVREDVNSYFSCQYDYSKCGFSAEFNLKDLDIEKKDYTILLKPDVYMKEAIKTNYSIIKGTTLASIDKTENVLPQFKSEKLAEILNGGKLLSYDGSVWIYQWNKELYWIMGNEYEFSKNDKTMIQYQIDTTQFDRLPKERKESGDYWGNESFYYEEYEITETLDETECRVAKKELPEDYSITRILSGYYTDGEYVWKMYFRPNYEEIISVN